MRIVPTLGLVAALALSACSAGGDAATATPSPSGKAMVTLSYQVPNGFAKVAAPSRSPQAGMSYDITTFEQDSSGCALQVMRVLMSSSNTMEDQDVTYNMVSGMATAQGVEDADKVTEGLYFPGEPGPVPGLQVAGEATAKTIRVAGRLSNESLQGFSLMMLCPRGKLDATVWKQFVEQVRVDGFQGSLEEH